MSDVLPRSSPRAALKQQRSSTRSRLPSPRTQTGKGVSDEWHCRGFLQRSAQQRTSQAWLRLFFVMRAGE
ncbi:MAG: hypothetical protein O3C17_26780, partial [Planctomycetota bacterium]|nr:hypothetical protein [Planctomycetota bacterium]